MLLNCCIREASWESLGQQGDQTSQSLRKSVLNIHWKEWCWSWSSNTLATWLEKRLTGKYPDAGKDWRQEKGTTEDEIVAWHHWLDGYEFEHLRELLMDTQAWCDAIYGVAKSRTWLSDNLLTDQLKGYEITTPVGLGARGLNPRGAFLGLKIFWNLLC